jgi:hypothetical protein
MNNPELAHRAQLFPDKRPLFFLQKIIYPSTLPPINLNLITLSFNLFNFWQFEFLQ